MGNEQAIPLSENPNNGSLPAFITISPTKSIPTDYELLIVIRGQRHTGKSSLISRMKGDDFSSDYEATPILSTAEIIWTSPKREKVRITVWDVVEKALIPQEPGQSIEYPDASTVDTYKRADGIVILIDSRFPDTVKLASEILEIAPESIPIVIFSNFQDEADSTPVIPDALQKYVGRFSFVIGSMKSNLGLNELNDWLNLPLQRSKSLIHLNKYKSLMDELKRKNLELTVSAEYFVDLETSKMHMPKPTVQKDGSIPQLSASRRTSVMSENVDEDGFWSDDDEDEVNNRIKKKLQNKKEDDDILFEADPNIVKRRIVKTQDVNKTPETTNQQQNKENEHQESVYQKRQQKRIETHQQPKIEIKKEQLPEIKDEDEDAFFDDDDDEENQVIPVNVNLKVLEEEDDDEPLRPNPLVCSGKAPRNPPAKTTIQKETKQLKVNEKKEEPPKVSVPIIEENGNDDGFFNDDDEEDNEKEILSKISPINMEDSDDEPLKPNPLVSNSPNKTTPTKPSQASENKPLSSSESQINASQENKVNNEGEVKEVQENNETKAVQENNETKAVQENNDTKAKEEESNIQGEDEKKENVAEVKIPTIETGEVDNDFFDDDDDQQEEIQPNQNEDEEELKPNPLVANSSIPSSESKPTTEIKPEVTNNQTEEVKTETKLPTIETGEVDNDFFNDDDDQQEEIQPNQNEDEEELKPNPLVSKPIQQAEEKKEIKEETKQQTNVSIPTLVEDTNENDDFFNDDNDDEDVQPHPNIQANEIKPNPLVSTENNSNLQASIEPNQEIKKRTAETNQEVDDFFSKDDEEPTPQVQQSNDYQQMDEEQTPVSSHNDYGSLDDTTTSQKPKGVYKRPKKLRKKSRAKQQTSTTVEDDTPSPAPPSSGDYESI